MSLRLRLLLAVAITFAIVVLSCVYAAHVTTSDELRSETDHFLLQRAHDPRVVGALHDERLRDGPGPQAPNLAEPDALVQLLDSAGAIAQPAPSELPVDAGDKSLATRGGTSRFRTVTVSGTRYRMLTEPIRDGAVQVARSVTEQDNVLSSLAVRLALIGAGGTIVAAGLAWLIAVRIVRPVERLSGAAELVARTQDLARPIAVSRRDELGRLAESFNTMLLALRTSRDQQKRLVADASHELRTPLTALRTNIEVLQRASDMEASQRAQMLADVEAELTELSALVAELVELATDARADEPVEPTDLVELVERVVTRMRRRTGREITLTVTSPATVTVRAGAIERVVSNLLDNACKFSRAPAPVDVRVDGTRIDVADRGTGIDDADRAYVFDRFYRAAAARTMPGSGLGLAIVKQLVELHGGSVELLVQNGTGTVARVTLPS